MGNNNNSCCIRRIFGICLLAVVHLVSVLKRCGNCLQVSCSCLFSLMWRSWLWPSTPASTFSSVAEAMETFSKFLFAARWICIICISYVLHLFSAAAHESHSERRTFISSWPVLQALCSAHQPPPHPVCPVCPLNAICSHHLCTYYTPGCGFKYSTHPHTVEGWVEPCF